MTAPARPVYRPTPNRGNRAHPRGVDEAGAECRGAWFVARPVVCGACRATWHGRRWVPRTDGYRGAMVPRPVLGAAERWCAQNDKSTILTLDPSRIGSLEPWLGFATLGISRVRLTPSIWPTCRELRGSETRVLSFCAHHRGSENPRHRGTCQIGLLSSGGGSLITASNEAASTARVRTIRSLAPSGTRKLRHGHV